MRISEVAARASVNVQTLRYYERRGLLREPERLRSGYRSYRADAVRVVRFIKHAQELGFTLADVDELLRLAAGEPGSCAAVRSIATRKIAELDRKISMLQAMRQSLRRLVSTCHKQSDKRDCPLIQAIEDAA
jgi:Hg(II)-responsive transcriptional regulator